jgi:hypothetical protein
MAQRKRTPQNDDTFYEAMPATARSFGYGGDMVEDEAPLEEVTDRHELTIDDTKTTAIVTLILTGLVAIGVALLFMRGLDIIKSATPERPANSITTPH